MDASEEYATELAKIKTAADSRYVKKADSENYTTAEKNKLAGLSNVTVDSKLSSSSENPVQNKVIKSAFEGLATVATSGSYNDLSNKPTLNDLCGTVTIEKQATAESGMASTYIVKQNGTQVGVKINIPKDRMVRSISVETVGNTPTSEESANNLVKGDQYIKMVVNTEDNDGATNLILPAKDIFEVQTADEVTLTLNGNVFSVKDGGITLAKLAPSVQTSLGYADAFNNSAAKNITDANITVWNNKSDLALSDVRSEIKSVLDALADSLSE